MRFKVWAALAPALFLAACGNLPRPFSPETKIQSPVTDLLPGDGAGVVVTTGDCPIAADAVIAALNRRDVPATTGPGNRGSMRLVCRAAERWRLADAGGGEVDRFTADDAEDVARTVAARLRQDDPAPPPVEWPAVIVTMVAGAPGDGALSLSRAMALALRGSGIDLAQETDETALVLVGSVEVSDGEPGSQFIEVIWELLSPEGTRLGVVSQENTIDAGALDGPWGPVAPVIAAAGAGGILDLMKRISDP